MNSYNCCTFKQPGWWQVDLQSIFPSQPAGRVDVCIVIQHLAEEAKGRRALKKAGRDTQQGKVKIQRYESSLFLAGP